MEEVKTPHVPNPIQSKQLLDLLRASNRNMPSGRKAFIYNDLINHSKSVLNNRRNLTPDNGDMDQQRLFNFALNDSSQRPENHDPITSRIVRQEIIQETDDVSPAPLAIAEAIPFAANPDAERIVPDNEKNEYARDTMK